ncbi:MAG: T9SS type A sorting domain-containing protein [Bacteroidota bacterium]|nr:T9SS type A sorting domain-containing protein [Bacteroidota bacterium]
MKSKLLSALLFTLISISLHATHQIGGYLTWRSVGPDTYVFTYVGLYDANSMSTNPALITNHPSVPNISMSIVSSSVVQNAGCVGDTTLIFKAESAPVTFSKPYPQGGLMVARRSNSYLSLGFVNATSSAPQFFPLILTEGAQGSGGLDIDGSQWLTHCQGIRQQAPLIFKNQGIDSISFSFASLPPDVITNNGVPQFQSPYSGTTQMPDSTFSSGSSPAVMDPSTGAFSFTSAVTGGFYIVRKVEHWRNGNVIATQYLMIPQYVLNCTGNNGDPNLNVVTGNGYPTHSWSFDNTQKGYLLSPGDSLQVEMQATDYDLNPNFTPQSITFTGYADPSLNVQFSPKAPQSGFVSPTNNNIIAKIRVPSSLSGMSLSRSLNVFGTFRDNYCPVRGVATARITIQVTVPLAIPDSLLFCSGDSLYLPYNMGGGSVTFNPSPVRVTSDKAVFWLTSSTNITATHSSGYSVSCQAYYQNTPKPNLTAVGGNVILQNPQDYDDFTIFLQGVPIAVNTPAVSVSLTGDYYAVGIKNGCSSLSDTVQISNLRIANTNLPSDPLYGQVRSRSSYGSVFTILQSGGALTQLKAIHLYGIIPDSSMVELGQTTLQIRDLNGAGAFQVDSLVAGPHWITAYGNGNLQNGVDYIVYVETDTTYSLNLQTPANFPYNDPTGRVRVYNGVFSATRGFPSVSSPRIPYIALEGPSNLEISENPWMGIRVFPIPSNEGLTIQSEQVINGRLTLTDLAGRTIESVEVNSQKEIHITRKGWGSGMYILRIQSERGGYSIPVIFR